MLVGHNPAITDFVNDLASLAIENVPTCGLLHFELAIDHWQQIAPGKATLIDFDYPKRQLPT
jgi:phosphohistidine phosphatase